MGKIAVVDLSEGSFERCTRGTGWRRAAMLLGDHRYTLYKANQFGKQHLHATERCTPAPLCWPGTLGPAALNMNTFLLGKYLGNMNSSLCLLVLWSAWLDTM